MTGKELIFQTLRHEPTPRAPWVPFAGVHAGALVGATATQVLTDEETLVRALLEVNRLYKPDGQPVVFDLQLEAEVLGCGLVWADDCPPSVSSHPLADTMTVPCRCTLPTAESGRMPMVLSAMRRMKEAVGDTTALYGLLCGPFTLASHLRGNDIFMDMFDDEDYVKDLLGFCADCAKRMSDLYLDAGMDVIAVVDSSFFVCGNATRNIEVMCRTAPDSISVDENVDILAAKAICDKYNVAIGGNIPLTSIMLHGTQQDNMKFVADLLAQLPEYKNFIVAPGCDMPYAVPVENTIGAAQAVLETEAVREMVKNYVAAEDDIAVELPDYENLPRPLIEVFTLDSATCAACTYMMGAANVAKDTFGDAIDRANHCRGSATCAACTYMMGAANVAKDTFGDAIDMVEYKFTLKENIARCKKMGVKNLPSIYINGKLKFSSIIPSKEELEAAVREVL